MDTVDTLIVSIGKEQAEFPWPWFYNHTDGWEDVDKPEVPIFDKIAYRAQRRNSAVDEGLKRFPDAKRILMVDSYYLDSLGPIKRLIQRHSEFPDCALGPVIWGAVRTNLSEAWHYRETFYDGWSTPELRWCPYGWNPETDILTRQEQVPLKGFYQVSSLGGCYIFPRNLWDSGIRYGVPRGVHGCEHNHFHSLHVLPKYVDFQTPLYRVKYYPLIKCARVSIGNWMRR